MVYGDDIKNKIKETAEMIIKNENVKKFLVGNYGGFDGCSAAAIRELKKTYSKQRNKRIDELQKENAELKSRDCWKGCLYASGKSELIHEFLQQKYNLTKAKEIIKDLLGSENTSCEEEMFFEIRQKAEQFLNSEVEK